MESKNIHCVTGAFGYSGKYIVRRLLEKNLAVQTLTNSLSRPNPFGSRIAVRPLDFGHPEKLAASLENVSVLYNTYWVRFNHGSFTHADAVKKSLVLFDCARKAGVERIVHVSITNPSPDSALEYFRGKAVLEQALAESGMSYAILRPAVLFGREDILINNIAWTLRRFPVFGVFGNGHYDIQPIHVDDLAELAVEQGQRRENCIIDAIGPETFTYRELVETIGKIIGKKRPVISLHPEAGYLLSRIVGKFVNDVFVTREEIAGLMAGLLAVNAPPAGKTRLTDWARYHRKTLGRRYTSELARRLDRTSGYRSN